MSQKNNNLYLYGKHAVLAALKNPRRKNQKLYITEEAFEEVLRETKLNLDVIKTNNQQLFAFVSKDAVHQGMVLKTETIFGNDINTLDFKKPNFKIIMLDQVTDPQNVGNIIRSAWAFGYNAVIMQDKNAPIESGSLAKAATGGLEHVKVLLVNNLNNTIKQLKQIGFWVVGMDIHTDKLLCDAPRFEKSIIVLGAEHRPIRPLLKAGCDFLCKIPINPLSDSVNVSTAAALAMYEFNRK